MDELEFTFERDYKDYQDVDSPKLVTEMRQQFHRLLLELDLSSKEALLEKIVLFRNNFYLSPSVTVRILEDRRTLKFARKNTRKQVSVCWWFDGCLSGSGTNNDLLCKAHAQYYYEVAKGGVKFFRIDPCDEKPVTEYPVTPNAKDSIRIRMCLTKLAHQLGIEMSTFNPLQIDEDVESSFCMELTGKRITHESTAITFDAELSCYLFMDLSVRGRVWKRICSAKQCHSLAYSTNQHCLAHILNKKDEWKRLVQRTILEIANVEKLTDINFKERLKFIRYVHGSQNKRTVIIPDCLYIYKGENGLIRVSYRGSTNFVLCENFGGNCGNVYNFGGNKACPQCEYKRKYTAFLLRLETGQGEDQIFAAIWISHIDSNFVPMSEITVRVEIRQKLRKLLNRRRRRIYDFVILERKDCGDGGIECAIAWAAGMYLYCLLSSKILHQKISFAHTQPKIATGMWKAANILCAQKGFQIRRACHPIAVSPPLGYEMYDPLIHRLHSQDFRSTTYEIKVLDLVYIGERTIRSAKGRKGVEYAVVHDKVDLDTTKCKQLYDTLVYMGIDPGKDTLPYQTITINTDSATSPFLPETMLILAKTIHEELFGNYDKFVVNRHLSSLTLNEGWFEDLQFLTTTLSGQTIEICGAENLRIQNSIFGNSDNQTVCHHEPMDVDA